MSRSTLALIPLLLLCACGKDPDPSYGDDTNPLTRTDEQLCRHWKGEYLETSGPDWTPADGTTCDLGKVPDAAQQNGLRRLNLYRWFVGLPAVPYDSLYESQEQYCAVMLAALGHIDHCDGRLQANSCPQSPCYTSDGVLGAGSSNLEQGTRLADSVDEYIEDPGPVGSDNYQLVGHRRWLLDPALASTTFGFRPRENYGFSCMHTLANLPPSQRAKVDYVSYPPPGPIPMTAAKGRFTFSSGVYLATSKTKVLVTIDGGPEAEVPATSPGGVGTLQTVLIYDPVAGHPEQTSGLFLDGRTVAIHITGLQKAGAAAEVSFEMRFVSCS